MRMHRVLQTFMAGCLALGAGCTATTGGLLGSTPAAGSATAGAKAGVDDLLVSSWLAGDLKISPPASDAEFLRRVSLDLIGRIPTLAETRAVLADSAPDRRLRLVDR